MALAHAGDVMRARGLAATVVSLVGLAAVCGGCVVPSRATPRTIRTGAVDPRPPALAVVFSEDFLSTTSERLGAAIVTCVTRGLRQGAPGTRLVSQAEFYRDVFPGLQRDEVLLRADTMPSLVARPPVRQRIASMGLTHLILVAGETRGHSDGWMKDGTVPAPGGAIAIGGWRITRTTRLTAAIFELDMGMEVARVDVVAEARGAGVGGILSIVPFAVGSLPSTESPSCDALEAEVARAFGRGP